MDKKILENRKLVKKAILKRRKEHQIQKLKQLENYISNLTLLTLKAVLRKTTSFKLFSVFNHSSLVYHLINIFKCLTQIL
jgi:hypothetical protein